MNHSLPFILFFFVFFVSQVISTGVEPALRT